jgi:hypothetical protein
MILMFHYLQQIGHSDKKNNKETSELNNPTDEMNLIDIHKILHTIATEFTCISASHVAFSEIDHITGHKARLEKDNKIEINS